MTIVLRQYQQNHLSLEKPAVSTRISLRELNPGAMARAQVNHEIPFILKISSSPLGQSGGDISAMLQAIYESYRRALLACYDKQQIYRN